MSHAPVRLPCRLIVDPPADVAWNMAVDEALRESATASGRCSLRFYQWQQPTLSLGYFQSHATRESHHASRACALVRRQTGGGAILHDRELTYSLVIPQAHPLAIDSARLYTVVHEAIQVVLQARHVPATICADPPRVAKNEEPFLCFQRRATGDMLWGAAKICGSAQRRRHGAVLQHGSLLLAQSAYAPELPGLLELCGHSLTPAELSTAIAGELAERLAFDFQPTVLVTDEFEAAKCLVSGKYRAPAWTERR